MSRQDEPQGPQRGSALERLVFFSDAIFAISITLLVLPLAETHIDQADAPAELHELLPEIYTFALSFVVIGMFWMQHHRFYRDIVAFDARLVRINLAFLFCIVFMPFPTAALARAGGSPTVTALYAGTIVVTSGVSTLMWWYASRDGGALLDPGVPRSRTVHRLAAALAALVPFVVSVPLAFLDADLAKYTWILVVPLSFVADRVLDRRART